MRTALEHIDAKLQRAEEHIKECDRRIERFLGDPLKREQVGYDAAIEAAFRLSHQSKVVPAGISVTTSDVLHQLRSSLDHLIAALILEDGGTVTRASQFPIHDSEPTEKDAIRDYGRRVKGIRREAVLAEIEKLQPYWGTNGGANCWLSILREFNNHDKHRSLMLHVTVVQPRFRVKSRYPGEDGIMVESEGIDDGIEFPDFYIDPFGERVDIVDVKRRLVPFVTFSEWPGAPMPVDVAGGLWALRRGVKRTVDQFREFLP